MTIKELCRNKYAEDGKFTKKELAKLSHYSVRQIYYIQSGKMTVSRMNAERISEVLGTSVDDIFVEIYGRYYAKT